MVAGYQEALDEIEKRVGTAPGPAVPGDLNWETPKTANAKRRAAARAREKEARAAAGLTPGGSPKVPP